MLTKINYGTFSSCGKYTHNTPALIILVWSNLILHNITNETDLQIIVDTQRGGGGPKSVKGTFGGFLNPDFKDFGSKSHVIA